MMTSVAASLRGRTGRSLEEWVDLVRRDGPDPLDQLAVRSWLRDVHSLRFRGTVPADERLAEAKGFAQASHWLHLPPDATPDDVRSLEPLLRAAYEQDG